MPYLVKRGVTVIGAEQLTKADAAAGIHYCNGALHVDEKKAITKVMATDSKRQLNFLLDHDVARKITRF